ncbi:transporter [Streptomyces sp. NPDC059467]|uniref:transporter n=1 Tax=Streptomyces sp. NPDC059467 TaxID=3346844 RepID=UPI00369CA7A5
MIWLTWRQSRTQAAVIYTAIALIAVILAVTGPQLLHLYNAGGGDFLNRAKDNSTDSTMYIVGALTLLAAPAVIGAFCGAPLIARELDAGTHRLIWNQSVTRTRWLTAKLGLTGLAAMAAAGLLSLSMTWWVDPIDKATGASTNSAAPVGFFFPRLSPVVFDARGIAPIGYAAFAFTLGVTIGVLTRRIVSAMALTLVGTAGTQIVDSIWIRPLLLRPDHVTTVITPANLLNDSTVNVHEPGAWITSTQIVDATGHQVTGISLANWMKCLPAPGQIDHACFAKLTSLGYRAQVSFQPENRFWAFQWYETAIFLALALALVSLCTWWIRRLS